MLQRLLNVFLFIQSYSWQTCQECPSNDSQCLVLCLEPGEEKILLIAEGGRGEGPAEEQCGAQFSSEVHWQWPSFATVWVLAERPFSSGAS